MIIVAVLVAIAVAVFPYVVWMTYLRGSGGQNRSRLRVVPRVDPHNSPTRR
jgi:hypothetical protein